MAEEDGQSLSDEKSSIEAKETTRKIIRVITVIAYLCSVSMAAIMLSLYYLFFWNPTVRTGPERLADPIHLRLTSSERNKNLRNDAESSEVRKNKIKGKAEWRIDRKMSKNSVSRGSSTGPVTSEVKFAGNEKDKMYEPKHRRKLVRVLTVVGYLFSVSLAAIMLSLFYVFIYNPGKASDDSKGHVYSQFPAQDYFPKESQDSFNDTYPNLEREEPRALPVQSFENSFQSDEEVDGTFTNFSLFYGNENKTMINKIIKLLKTQ